MKITETPLNKIFNRLDSLDKKTDRNYRAIIRLKGRVILIAGAVSVLMFLASLLVKERFLEAPRAAQPAAEVQTLRYGWPISPMENDRGRCILPNNGRYPCRGVVPMMDI